MAVRVKTVLISGVAAALALGMAACGGSTSSTSSSASSASSAASSAVSSATSSASAAAEPAAAGTLAGVCTEIDAIMMGTPDADPAGTAEQLEAIAAEISTPDAELVENVAAAYSAIAANPDDTAAQEKLSASASALGAGCQSATQAPGHS